MNDGAVISTRTSGGTTIEFPIYRFASRININSISLCTSDGLTKLIQEEVPWFMPFANDILLVDEIRCGVNVKLEI